MTTGKAFQLSRMGLYIAVYDVRLKDIARDLGLSVVTVSRFFDTIRTSERGPSPPLKWVEGLHWSAWAIR
jgi:hypothetical protein